MNNPVPASRPDSKNTCLLVGSLSGVGYALGTWGIDAILLAGAHGMYPFLKLVTGALVCAVLGMLAGWLSHRFVNVFFNFIIWASAGAAFNRFAEYLNFPGMQALLNWLDPEVGSLVNYSIDYGVSTRGTLMLIISIVAFGLIGLFANSTVEEADANVGVRRGISMMIWMALFLAVGYLGASLNTNPMRDAVVVVDRSIQFNNEHAGEELSNEVKLEMGLFGLKKIEPYAGLPYKLIVTSYDKMLIMLNVLVQYEEQNAICPVMNGSLGTCFLIEE